MMPTLARMATVREALTAVVDALPQNMLVVCCGLVDIKLPGDLGSQLAHLENCLAIIFR